MEVALHTIAHLVIIMILAVPNFLHPYIYRVHVMQLEDSMGRGKRVVALSDYHDKKHPATVEQKIDYVMC